MKKLFSIFIILCMLLPLTACGWEKTVTFYVPTEQRVYFNGELDHTILYQYDDRARVVRAEMVQEHATYGTYSEITEFTYDEHGTISKIVGETVCQDANIHFGPYITEYTLTYTDDRLTSYTRNEEGDYEYPTAEFEYDSKGRITQINYVYESEEMKALTGREEWQKYVYDKKGNLIQEYGCYRQRNSELAYKSIINYLEYGYDKDGKLTTIDWKFHLSEELMSADQVGELEFSDRDQFFLYYDTEGKLACVNKQEEITHDGSPSTVYSNPDNTFDEHGNLIRFQYGNRGYIEYTYQAMEVTESDARMARQLMNSREISLEFKGCAYMDPLSYTVADATFCAMQSYYVDHSYLIYRPYWDAAYGG